MSKKKHPKFNEVKKVAKLLAERFKCLESAMYFTTLSTKASRIREISTTLEVIANTPNATINRDALEAWQADIRDAHKDLKSWCKGILKFGDATKEEDDGDWGGIPF
ncbi:hypothetical protein P12x_005293 [Tundrisphaera lichenicola]|uniref:hypothetical protein n=1 Tax=Tundrisphaera lichenicola TaxID=2029860 RepID=UPI003EBA7343